MEIIYLPGSSSSIYKHIEIIKEHLPIKKITTFFDYENFIITEYTPYSSGVTMIIECSNGDQLHIESCNCGYEGQGPHATVSLLKALGISKNDSEYAAFNTSGFQIDFIDNKYVITHNINIFEFRDHFLNKYQIKLEREKIQVDTKERNVYLFKPKGKNFADLFILLKYINVKEIEYYISYIDQIKMQYNIPERFNLKKRDCTIIVKGDKFNILCFIDKEIFSSVLNSIHCFATGKPYFTSNYYNNIEILTDKSFLTVPKNNIISKIQLILYIIGSKSKPSHNIIPIIIKEKNKSEISNSNN